MDRTTAEIPDLVAVLSKFSSAEWALIIASSGVCAILITLIIRFFNRGILEWMGKTPHIGTSDPSGIKSIFTDFVRLRGHFADLLIVPALPKRLLIIHGVGGIGKSSVLRMFWFHGHDIGVPITLVSGDEVKTPAEILYGWARDLERQVPLPLFIRKYRELREISQNVARHKDGHADVENARAKQGRATKTGLKILAQAAVTLLGLIPVLGPAVAILVGGTSDAAVEWLQNFLTKSQIDLYLDPTEQLTDCFIADLVAAQARARSQSKSGRIALLLDAYEKVGTLDQWFAYLAQRLPSETLLVVSGRATPTGWASYWQDIWAYADVEEIKPMTDEVMRELVHRYYFRQMGSNPPSAQVETIIRFARGLPIAITTIVQLWIQYHDPEHEDFSEDFQAVKPRVIADLVDRLTKEIPDEERPALNAAAILRWFNLELLRVVSSPEPVSESVYADFRRFPFVRPHKHGHALHDLIREYLDDNLRIEQPARHRTLHMHAADYFYDAIEQSDADGMNEAIFEEMYHRVMADEEKGMEQVCKRAEEYVRYQLVSPLRALVNDMANYPLLQVKSQRWRDYYQARLFDLEGHGAEATALYQAIADDERAPERLRAYALVDWAWITRQYREQMGAILRRFQTLFPNPDLLAEPDAKLGIALFELAEFHWGEWDTMLEFLERARRFYQRIEDSYWLPYAYNRIKYHYLDRGMWRSAANMQEQGLLKLGKLASERERTYLRAEFLAGASVGWMWAGQYHQTEMMAREALSLAERFERVQQEMYFRRDLGLVLGLQGRLEEAQQQFARGLEIGPQLDPLYEMETREFEAIVMLRWKGPKAAASLFAQANETQRRLGNASRVAPGFLNWSGAFYEQQGEFALAEECYRECRNQRQQQQWHWHTGALVGLVRIFVAREDPATLEAALREADETLNQHPLAHPLASLRLSQAHLTWDERVPGDEHDEQGFNGALRRYQEALMYALHFNRFLLDDVLSGHPGTTPFHPIIPHCLERGEEGKHMLRALVDWWNTAYLQQLTPEPESLALLPVGVRLTDLEQQIRAREPGDGKAQDTVATQIQNALS